MLRAEGSRRAPCQEERGSPEERAGGSAEEPQAAEGSAWTEAGVRSRDRDGLAACREPSDRHENKAQCEPLFTPNIHGSQ